MNIFRVFIVSILYYFSLTLARLKTDNVAKRAVYIDGQHFIERATNKTLMMSGPNVVVKGPPYLPSVDGKSVCSDVVNDDCGATGTCTTCYTFNEADVQNLKDNGWNTIRLGVAWAGAQPRNEDGLDSDFLRRLHAILDLTDATGIHVVLDNHGDMVGTAGCGNGVPMWIQQLAAPDLIGKPLMTNAPYKWAPGLDVTTLDGYDVCGDDPEKWAVHAGDANYNLLNECCQAMNSPNPGALGYTSISQKTMDYIVSGAGRDAFVRYWRLLAEAVRSHPSAVAAELMNEPMTLWRHDMYETWRAAAEAINAVIPDLSVAVTDTGEAALLPAFITDHAREGAGFAIDPDTVLWMKESSTLFYAWHWYGSPSSADRAVANALAVGHDWNMPTFATEFMDCAIWQATEAAGISHSYWHYSSYCDTGPYFGNKQVPEDTFGACILGWAGGSSAYSCETDQ